MSQVTSERLAAIEALLQQALTAVREAQEDSRRWDEFKTALGAFSRDKAP